MLTHDLDGEVPKLPRPSWLPPDVLRHIVRVQIMRISRCHLFCGTILLLLTCALGTQWTPSTYPNPSVEEGFKLCKRPGKSFVCDPDSIISRKSANVVS